MFVVRIPFDVFPRRNQKVYICLTKTLRDLWLPRMQVLSLHLREIFIPLFCHHLTLTKTL